MKFSKLCLVPLLALGLVGCGTVDPTATPGSITDATSSVPEGPTWGKEDAALIKGALGGYLIPLLDFENGKLSIEEIPEAEGGGQIVAYTILNPKTSDRVDIVNKFVADGYEIQEPEPELGKRSAAEPTEPEKIEVVAIKKLPKKHLYEALALNVTEATAPNGTKFVKAEVMYYCDVETNEWPAEEIEAYSKLNMVRGYVPEPEFEYTHISNLAGEEGDGYFVYALYFGDHAADYAHTLAKSDYDVEIQAEEILPEEEAELSAAEAAKYEYTYAAHDDLFATDIYVYYDSGLDATIIEVGMGTREQWHGKAISLMAKKAGIQNFYLPKPYMPMITYEFGLTLKGETPEEGLIFDLYGITTDENGPELYCTQLLNAGYIYKGHLIEEEVYYETFMSLDSLCLLKLSMEEIPTLGIMFDLTAEALPTSVLAEADMVEINDGIETELGVTATLPIIGGAYAYTEVATDDGKGGALTDRFDSTAVYFDLYCYPSEETNALIAASLISNGYVKEETDQYLGFYNAETQLFVEIANYTLLPNLTRLIISKKVLATTWEDATTAGGAKYADFVTLVGEDNVAAIPYPTALNDASKFLNAEVDLSASNYAAFMYAGAYLEEPTLTAYLAQLVEAGWVKTETTDDNFGLPLYTKTIGGNNFGICAGAVEDGMLITCVGVYKLAK